MSQGIDKGLTRPQKGLPTNELNKKTRTQMTKAQMISKLKACYRVGNASDADLVEHEDWTTPEMATEFCRALDKAFRALLDAGVISADEHQKIYDTL